MKTSFKPFYFDPKLAKIYLKGFKKLKEKGLLYKKTPESVKEVRVWFEDVIANKNIKYFFVYVDKKLAGHIGLREIDYTLKTAEVGEMLFSKLKKKEKIIKASIKFIIDFAKKQNLKMIFVDLVSKDKKRSRIYKDLDFKQDVVKENRLFILV